MDSHTLTVIKALTRLNELTDKAFVLDPTQPIYHLDENGLRLNLGVEYGCRGEVDTEYWLVDFTWSEWLNHAELVALAQVRWKEAADNHAKTLREAEERRKQREEAERKTANEKRLQKLQEKARLEEQFANLFPDAAKFLADHGGGL